MADKPDSKQIARAVTRMSVWGSLGHYATLVLSTLSLLVLTRLLPPEVFGAVSLAGFWIRVISVHNYLGLNQAAVTHDKSTGSLAGTFFVLQVTGFSITAGLGCLLLLTLAATRHHAPEVLIAIAALILTDAISLVANTISMLLERELQVSRISLFNLIASIFAYGLAIVLALNGLGIWSILAIGIVVATLNAGAAFWICKTRLPNLLQMKFEFDAQLAKSLLTQGAAIGLGIFLGGFATTFDNYLVGTLAGEQALGFYDRAYRIASWPNLLGGLVIGRVVFLALTKVAGNEERTQHTIRMGIWFIFLVGMPLAVALSIGAPDIVQGAYGARYAISATYLRVLALTSVSLLFNSLTFWLSTAQKDKRAIIGLQAVPAVLLLVLGSILGQMMGINGVLIAVIVAFSISLVAGLAYIAGKSGVRLLPDIILPMAVCAVAYLILQAFYATALAPGTSLSLALASVVPSIAGRSLASLMKFILLTLVTYGVCIIGICSINPRETLNRLRYLKSVWRQP